LNDDICQTYHICNHFIISHSSCAPVLPCAGALPPLSPPFGQGSLLLAGTLASVSISLNRLTSLFRVLDVGEAPCGSSSTGSRVITAPPVKAPQACVSSPSSASTPPADVARAHTASAIRLTLRCSLAALTCSPLEPTTASPALTSTLSITAVLTFLCGPSVSVFRTYLTPLPLPAILVENFFSSTVSLLESYFLRNFNCSCSCFPCQITLGFSLLVGAILIHLFISELVATMIQTILPNFSSQKLFPGCVPQKYHLMRCNSSGPGAPWAVADKCVLLSCQLLWLWLKYRRSRRLLHHF
jgi:hypothetical protein